MAGRPTPSYDANGNQLTDGSGRSSVFNIRDQVTSITPSGGQATAIVSRGTNQEDQAGVGGSEVVTNALGVASTSAGSSYYTRDNTGGLLAKRTSAGTPSATKYYLQDALGSVAALTSSTGSQTDPSTGKYVYDPYGNPRGTAPAEFGWQSAYRAPGGLIHFGYRYYDPYTGAWTQQDPLNQASDLTQADRYTYAGGDPINGGDPSGASALHSILNAVSAAVYAPYYVTHQSGLGGTNATALGVEVASLAADAGLDAVKSATLHNGESIGDEGIQGPVNPFSNHCPCSYLPGIHSNGSVDLP